MQFPPRECNKHAETADPTQVSNPQKLTPSTGEAVCLSCHKNNPSQIGRIRSGHGKELLKQPMDTKALRMAVFAIAVGLMASHRLRPDHIRSGEHGDCR